MKPDFNTISLSELRAYVLSHRGDDEAFYKLADRIEESSEGSELYPMPDTPESIEIMELAIREHVQKLEGKSKN
jgi:hypothetical protein